MEVAEKLAHMRALFDGLQWWWLRPCPQLLLKQPGELDITCFASIASSPEVDLIMAYLPFGGALTLHAKHLPATSRSSRFFDPRMGTLSAADMHEEEGGTITVIAPREGEDWVWLLVP
jgi:hypothetical protein